MQEFLYFQLWQFKCIVPLFITTLCAALIGYEREHRAKAAGIKTHVLVALGACIAMLVSKYGFDDVATADAGRIAAQVMSGMGFIGAGVIFVRGGMSVHGLTTAAGIWATAAIGLAIGGNLYILGILATLFIYGFQVFFHNYHLFERRTQRLLELKLSDGSPEVLADLRQTLESNDIQVRYTELRRTAPHGSCDAVIRVDVSSSTPARDIANLLASMSIVESFKL